MGATRAQIMHYREQAEQAAAYAAAGVDFTKKPRGVPELPSAEYVASVERTAAGGRLALSAFRPAPITEPAPFADVWGDAR